MQILRYLNFHSAEAVKNFSMHALEQLSLYHIHHAIIQHATFYSQQKPWNTMLLLNSLPEYATESVIEVFLSALHQVKPSDSQH